MCQRRPTCQNTTTATGSAVNNITRGYRTEGPALSVKVPGGWLSVAALYKDGRWMIEPARIGLDGIALEATSLFFHYYGDDEKGYVLSAILKDGNIAYKLPEMNFALKTEYDANGKLTHQEYVYTGEQIYIHDTTYTIRPTAEGYLWTNKSGAWKLYDLAGRWMASGDRYGATGFLLYDQTDRVVGYADRSRTQAVWFDYNAEGLLAKVRDAQGRSVDYTYYPATASGQIRLQSIKDVFGQETVYTYEEDTGRVQQILKPGGAEVHLAYNAAGNVLAVTDAQGLGYAFQYNYDPHNKEYYAMITQPSGDVKEIWYDENGQTKRVDVNGTTVQTVVQEDHALITTDPSGLQTRQEYDEWNNLTKIVYPDGATESYEYEHTYNQVIKEVDQAGLVRRLYEYNAKGQVIKLTLEPGTDEAREFMSTYDAEDRLATETMHWLGTGTRPDEVTTYIYNTAGQMVQILHPDNPIEITYNKWGDRLTWKDQLNGEYRYIYDDYGRLLETIGPIPNPTP